MAKLTDDEIRARYEQRVGWYGDIPEGHYAVPDPHEADRVTMWRVKNGRMEPWPKKTRQGPIVYRKDAPRDRDTYDAWLQAWIADVKAYRSAVTLLIVADPAKAAARYASVTFRCALCNRELKVPESNAYGVGPECRSWMPPELLRKYARQVSRVRAELMDGGAA